MAINAEEVLSWFDLVRWHQGKWVPDIIIVLSEGPMRSNDLFHEVRERNIEHRWSTGDSPVSKQSFTRTLHAMERDELVLRCEDNSQNPRAVYYELSPLVQEFLEDHTRAAVEWAEAHRELFDRVRQRRQEPDQDEERPA